MSKPIFKMAVVGLIGFSSVACLDEERRVAKYGVGGAALGTIAGAALTGTTDGAASGAVLGAAVGTFSGVAQNKKKERKSISLQPMCQYRHSNGQIYQMPCPQTVQLCTYSQRDGTLYTAPCIQ
ncbi:glycine zipper family protein [Bartonella ancashensis]|uniref:Lipoprotein, VirB7-like n=1 Tax=Bartonella ancashensis TaxID=1318743 RepID=A0A0M4LFS7_9HYPH|nr:glycine zipper family protein [Bartonella ancashensis]ALE03144.1 Lipoprotein, VirB7-like [Bartonella ancashensis]